MICMLKNKSLIIIFYNHKHIKNNSYSIKMSADQASIELFVRNELKAMNSSWLSSLEELKTSFNTLKQEMQECNPIIRDFKGLLQRKPLFERSTFVYLSPLAKEIKSEVLREISSKLIETTEDLKTMKTEVAIQLEDLSEKTALYKSFIEDLNQDNKIIKDDTRLLHTNLDIIKRNLDDDREDLLLKAPYQEVNRLLDKINKKASIDQLTQVKEQLDNCPSKEQVELLYSKIDFLNQQLASFASKDMVKEMELGLMENVETKIEQFVNTQTLNEEIERVTSLIRETNSSMEYFKIKIEKIAGIQKKDMERIQKLLQARP